MWSSCSHGFSSLLTCCSNFLNGPVMSFLNLSWILAFTAVVSFSAIFELS
uniref:Uncharacterized protein n=1 Tax=Arundo donax TaxID=35708 RepID=A0A0A8ZDZ3_ARUDO